MKLNRQAIQRMINAGDLNIGGRRGGGSGAGGGGGVSAAWVEQNYISKAFFARIFKVWVGYGSSKVEIEPNDEMPTPDTSVNIQAVYGLWTEKFLTALGEGTGGGGGGGGASTLAELNDVTLTNPQNGNLLQYNGTHWVNITLASLMADYATKQWCNSTFATIASLADNATQSWVNQQGFIKIHPSEFWGQAWPTSANTPIKGDIKKATSLEFSEIGSSAGHGGYIDFHYNGGGTDYTSRIIEEASGVIKVNNTLYAVLSGNVGIGESSPQHKLHVNGGIYSTSYVTALSDIRMKRILDRFVIGLDTLVKASLIRFTWKDGHDDAVHAGIIAQEWREILPEAVVKTEDGTLAADYGVIGTAAALSLARKVKEQQQEIDELKKKNANLEARLAKIEKMFALTED